jgi:hypothetical protein
MGTVRRTWVRFPPPPPSFLVETFSVAESPPHREAGFGLIRRYFRPSPPPNIRTNTPPFAPSERPKMALWASLSLFSSDDPQIRPKEKNGSTTLFVEGRRSAGSTPGERRRRTRRNISTTSGALTPAPRPALTIPPPAYSRPRHRARRPIA